MLCLCSSSKGSKFCLKVREQFWRCFCFFKFHCNNSMHLSCLDSENCITWKCVLSQPDLRVFQRAYCHVKGALLSISWSAPCVWGYVTIEESPRWQITGHTCSYPTPEDPRNTLWFELFCSVSHFPSCLSSYIYPFVNSRNLKTGFINTHCLFPLLRRGFHTATNSWKVYHPSVI